MMDKNFILTELNHIEAAAQSVYIKGCDDVARSNLAQLIGICNAVRAVREELAKGEETNA